MLGLSKRRKREGSEVGSMKMRVGWIAVLVVFAAALGCGSCSAAKRPMVGFLPFQGGQGTYTYVIPYAINWELGYVPGIGTEKLEQMMYCVELDKLAVPSRLDDTGAYSRLAAATGVDYLVTGEVESQTRSRARFRVVVFSAVDGRFRKEYDHECAMSGLMDEAVLAAKEVAGAAGVPAGGSIEFDTQSIDASTLGLLDESIRLRSSCEADQSRWDKSMRLASKARSQCPTSPMVRERDLSYSYMTTNGLEAYEELSRSCPRNLAVLASTKCLYAYLHRPGKAREYSRAWLKLDPTSTIAQVIVNGKPDAPASGGWRNELEIAYACCMVGDTKNFHASIQSATARQPRSAYLQYCAGRYLSRVGEWDHAAVAYQRGVEINSESFRLRMNMVRAYMRGDKNDDALAILKPLLKRWPNNSEAHVAAAMLYRRWKQFDKAANEMEAVERLNPDGEINHDVLASDYLSAGRAIDAVHELAQGSPSFRKGMTTVAFVMTGIFLVGVLGVAVLVRVVIGRS